METTDRKTENTAGLIALRLNFSDALRDALVARLGKLPSATHLANQYNLRAHGTTTISRETARKWMNGQAVPEMPRLNILIDWLSLDKSKFLSRGKIKKPLLEDVGDDDLTLETIVELLRQMDAKTRSVVLITAWALRETSLTPLGPLNLQALKRTLMGSLIESKVD